MSKKAKEQPGSGFLAAAKVELTAQLEVCAARRRELHSGGFDPELATCAASLGRAITSLASEERQQEKHAAQMVARMSPEERAELTKEYLRELPVDRRADFRAFLDDLDADERVLGS